MIRKEMNADRMSRFLERVSRAHSRELVVMVVDGASSHRPQDLRVPEKIRLHRLPGDSLELNPQEHVWDELRGKEFPNRVCDSRDGVLAELESWIPAATAPAGLPRSRSRIGTLIFEL